MDQTENERCTNRVTVADAARLLGLSAEAVRMRIKRGTLASEKVGSTVYVLLEADPTRTNGTQIPGLTADPTSILATDQTELVAVLREEVAFLREELKRREEAHLEENRRKDTIIAQLTQRIPQLPPAASQESPQASGTAAGGAGSSGDDVPPDVREPSERRSWLHRFFFGP